MPVQKEDPRAGIEQVELPAAAPYVATITDRSQIKARFGVAGWRYSNKKVVLKQVMPDGGIVETGYLLEMDVSLIATDQSFEAALGRGMHAFQGCHLVVARNERVREREAEAESR